MAGMAKKDPPSSKPEDSLREVHKLLAERKQEEHAYATEKSHPAAVASSSAEADAYKRRLQEMQEQNRLEKMQQEAQQREQQQRLEAAERRAHTEGQAKLGAFQQDWYQRTYTTQPWPWTLLVAMVVGFVGLAVAIGTSIHYWNQSRLSELTQKQDAEWDRALQESRKDRQGREEELTKLRTQVRALQNQTESWKKQVEERQAALQIQEQEDAKTAQERAIAAENARREQEEKDKRDKAIQAEKDARFKKCQGSDDPLCGIGEKSNIGEAKSKGRGKKRSSQKKESPKEQEGLDIL